MALVAGVDSGTQSTKVVLRDLETGRAVAIGRAPHPPTSPPRSEQDPEAWWTALVAALSRVSEFLPEVAALSVAGQQHGLVLLDEDGAALRPAKLWNDTESTPEARALVAGLGSEGWARACGTVPTASFTITKLAWVAAHEPQVLDRVAHVMLPHDYLTWRLTGARVTDRGEASGTGWWSPAQGVYRPDLLSRLGLDVDLSGLLPAVLGPREAAGRVVASGLGLAPDTVVGPGTGDNMAGALGLGLGPGDLAVSVGTSGTAYAVSNEPTHDVAGEVAGFADATGRFLPLVCTLNATKVTDTVARLLGVDHATFDELALAAEPGAGGVTLVPYLDGERTPDRPDATGSLTGLRSGVTRGQLARAAVEGVVCGLLEGVDALRAVGVPLDGRFFLLGGGARSAAFRRCFADLSGRPLVVPDAEETVATGAGLQAAAVLTGRAFEDLGAAWGLGTGIEVAPRAVDADGIRHRYRESAVV